MTWLTTPFLAKLHQAAPHVDMGLLHLMPSERPRGSDPWQESLERLERRDVDVAVLPLHSVPARFAARRLYHEDFVVAMRKGHRFARTATIAEFCKSRHLLVSLDGNPHGFVDDVLARRGLTRRIALTVPTFTMALAQLATADMIAVLPRRLVASQAARFGLAIAELPFHRKADPIVAVVAKPAMMDEGIAFVVDALAASAAALD